MVRKLHVCVSVGLSLLILALPAQRAEAQNLSISANSVAFFATQGNNPAAQSIFISPGAGLNPAINVVTANGGSWLSVVGVTSGLFTENYQLGFNVQSQSLPIGDYFAQVTVTQAGIAQFPLVIPVTLKVIPPGAYLVPIPSVINLSVSPGASPANTALILRNVGNVWVTPTFSKTSTGGDWISLSAPVASTLSPDVNVTVSYATSGLTPGFYSGVITATASTALNSPVNVPVNLRVGTTTVSPTLAVTPTSLSFTAAGGLNPAPQTISLTNSGQGTIDPLVQTSTVDGAGWLSVTSSAPGAGGARTLTASINISGLALGSYSGRITVIDSGSSNSPLVIPVSLTVSTVSPALLLRTNTVAFSVATSGPRQTTTVDVLNPGGTSIAFTTSVTTSSGGNWLSVSPSSGTTPATLTITADPTGLARGVYQGRITVTGGGVSQDINVILGISTSLPTINGGGFVNGASFASQILAPGEIGTAFGVDFGLSEGVTAAFVNGRLPTQLSGLSITFDGTPGPLFFANNFQINVQLPFELAGKTTTQVQVVSQRNPGPFYTLNLRAADPAVFQANGRMTVFNQANQQILVTRPAAGGDILTMYATGLGPFSAALASGAPAPTNPPITTATTPVITVGGRPATILFSGGAPGFVGLYQINFTVPTGLSPGDQPLILSIGAAQSLSHPLAVR